MRTEQITPAVCGLGEGPVWDSVSGSLLCVDLLAGDVLRLRPDGDVRRHRTGLETVGALRPRRGGGFVLAAARGFAYTDDDLSSVEVLPDLWNDRGVRMNDGACDPHGRFLAGSMAYDARPGGGGLFRLHPSGAVEQVLDNVTISNGIDWSPDGSLAYYVDTPTQRIDVFDDDGTGLSDRRPFVQIPADAGSPDGITVDADGGVWVALWGGAAVHRYDPSGVLSAVVEVPATHVTACAFGGPGLDQLYVTTSRDGDQRRHPRARHGAEGAVHVAEASGLRGLPPRVFGDRQPNTAPDDKDPC